MASASAASVAVKLEGRRKGTTVYSVDGYLFNYQKSTKVGDTNFYIKCAQRRVSQCDAPAKVCGDSLFILGTHGEHSCTQDPDEVARLSMENDMKRLAETTARGFREIYDTISLLNPAVAVGISFPRMESAMLKRRQSVTPVIPANFNDALHLLTNSPVYNAHLKKSFAEDDGDRGGALIFSSDRCLERVNSSNHAPIDPQECIRC